MPQYTPGDKGRLDRLPARLRPAGGQFVDYLVVQQHRAGLYGGASLSDKTIAHRINVLLQLADHLDARSIDDWAAVTAADTDPRERVVGLLCLLHAASNNDVRMLTIDDIDLDHAAARLRNRRHPVPLDPLTIDAIRACLEQRPTTATDNRYLLVTHHSRQHNRPCSIDFPVRILTTVALTPQVLRQTRLSDLAQRADPRMMAAAIGITRKAALHYTIGNVHRAELAFPGGGDQTQSHDLDQEQPHSSGE